MNYLTVPERALLLEYLEAGDVQCRFLTHCLENIHDPSFQTLCKVQKAYTEKTLTTLSQFLKHTEADWEGGQIYGTRNFPM